EKSSAQLTLFALTNVSDSTRVNVNLLSHLEFNRVLYLIQEEGKSISDAKQKAQQEIIAIFGIARENMTISELLDISQVGEDNAILLAISAVLQGDQSVAGLSELLANISTDIREDGAINSQATLNKIKQQGKAINLLQVRNNLEQRYEEIGVKATIPNFEQYIDSDGDGILNKDEDDTPEPFEFSTQVDVAVNDTLASNTVTISGIKDGGIAVSSVSNGQFVVNGLILSDSIVDIKNGDKLQLRLISSDLVSDTTTASLTIGSLTRHFSVVTDDYLPGEFSFASVENAKRDSAYSSNTITISGLPHPTPISVDRGTILINGIETSGEGTTVKNGDQLTVTLRSSSSFSTTGISHIYIGNTSKQLSITTEEDPLRVLDDNLPMNVNNKGIYLSNSLYYLNASGELNQFDLLSKTWHKKTGNPELFLHYGNKTFTLDNKLYLCFGFSEVDWKYHKEFWVYDPETDQWTEIAEFEGETRQSAEAFTINNKAYVGFGEGKGDLWEYNPETNAWTYITDYPGDINTNSESVTFVLGNKIFVGYQNDRNSKEIEFWKYDIDQMSWKKAANNRYVEGNSSSGNYSFVLHGKGYVGNNKHLSLYNPDNDTWKESEYSPITKSIYGLVPTDLESIYFLSEYSLFEFTPPLE
ncbi:MAG: hypothetical protein RJQ14_05135, partial [Marinoscillum sp.]